MTVEAHKETLGFQAEVQQILRLVINSLYSHREIFLRELISNASDACDKLRFEALQDDGLYGKDPHLAIRVTYDKDAKTLTVADNGIGMSRDEVVQNIGTIAHSGTRKFLEAMTGDQAKDAQLIGQFGVGFYSSFIVADHVTLTTRRAGCAADEGVRWSSDGKGTYTLETVAKADRGTEVTLHLGDEAAAEFLSEWRLRDLITRYSDHIGVPVMLWVEKAPAPGATDSDKPTEPEKTWEQVNRASALWMRPKGEIQDRDYRELYKHLSHDYQDPLAWSHNRVEGKLEYVSLLYIPNKAPFDLWDRDRHHGVKLYVKRVFILDDAEQLLPRYLRFVRGVVDSDDLPLNVSRELLQSNRVVDQIRAGSTKKLLGLLETLAKDEPDKYHDFWDQFGVVLKEGPGEDFANKDQLAKLLRFASTHDDAPNQRVALTDYAARMKEGQKAIYYITADSHAAAKRSPHLEICRQKGVEVLLLSDRVDEWLVAHLTEFDGKPLQSVAKGRLDLDDVRGEDAGTEAKPEPDAEEFKDLLTKARKVLVDRVGEVRLSKRLTDSPACLVMDEHAMSAHLERLLKETGKSFQSSKPHLELNPHHALVLNLKAEADQKRFEDLVQLLFDQALLAEGGQLEDPASFVQRLNQLLLRLSA
ncbi:MAG: molecular chaperone HtpG [Candidatus Competibacterales bacterium]